MNREQDIPTTVLEIYNAVHSVDGNASQIAPAVYDLDAWDSPTREKCQ